MQARYHSSPMEGVQGDMGKAGGTLPGFLLIKYLLKIWL